MSACPGAEEENDFPREREEQEREVPSAPRGRCPRLPPRCLPSYQSLSRASRHPVQLDLVDLLEGANPELVGPTGGPQQLQCPEEEEEARKR